MTTVACSSCGKPVAYGQWGNGVFRCIDCALKPKPEGHSQKIATILRSAREQAGIPKAPRCAEHGHSFKRVCSHCGQVDGE